MRVVTASGPALASDMQEAHTKSTQAQHGSQHADTQTSNHGRRHRCKRGVLLLAELLARRLRLLPARLPML